jgi:F-type H+-transporting ATPase subunit b
MNHFILLAQAGGGGVSDTVKDIANTFGVDWSHLIAQIISFTIVAIALYKLAYKPVLTILDERRQRIAEGLANAERIKEELAKTEIARQEVLAQANAQATRLIEEARAAAARVQEQETQKAVAEAAQIIAKAQEAAALEKTRTMIELRREIGRLVVQTTSRVTGKILSPEDQQRLAEETSRQLAE